MNKQYYKKNERNKEPPFFEDYYDRDSNEDFSIARFYDYCNPQCIDFEIIENYDLTPIQQWALNSLLI